MKEINASVQVLNIPEATDRIGVLSHLELIGRICYKSEDKITEESSIKFIQNIRNRKHWAMLEHYIFALAITKEIYDDIRDAMITAEEDHELIHKLKFINLTRWKDSTDSELRYIVSGSATAFNYLWECNYFQIRQYHGIVQICQFIQKTIPEIMSDPWNTGIVSLDNNMRFLSREEIRSLPQNIRLIHDFQSVIFTVDRGVTHELVRHRPASWAQESTRYCNYASGKHENEITVIKPFFFNDPTRASEYNTWKLGCKAAETTYLQLINDLKASAQEARSVLPQSVKADIAMTASLGEFRHFFKMRVPKSAHPQMREVAIPLLNFMKVSCKGIYDEMICYGLDEDLTIVDKEG